MIKMTNRLRMWIGQIVVLTVFVAPGIAASEPKYLALGDSISFGYHPVPPPPQPVQTYMGYPEILGSLSPTPDINLSCPGQSSTTFLDPSKAATSEVPGANCEIISIPDLPGWKASLPLHNNYT